MATFLTENALSNLYLNDSNTGRVFPRKCTGHSKHPLSQVYLFMAAPEKRSCFSLPWASGISSELPSPLTLNME